MRSRYEDWKASNGEWIGQVTGGNGWVQRMGADRKWLRNSTYATARRRGLL